MVRSVTWDMRLVVKASVAGAAAGVCLFVAGALAPVGAHAASSAWPEIYVSYQQTSPVKVGSYYFKEDANYGLVWSRSKTFEKFFSTNMDSSGGAFLKGNKAYYIDESKGALYRYDFKTAKATKVKKLSAKLKSRGGEVTAVYGNNVFISSASFDEWRYWTNIYNLKTKKMSKSLGKFSISDSKGQYAVTADEYRTDVSGYSQSLYKFTSKGLKKIKRIAKYGQSALFVGDKLYYTTSPSKGYKKLTLYRAKMDGTHKKKIVTWAAKKTYSMVMVTNVTSKTCYVRGVKSGDNWYRYTYKTKKYKKLYY